MSNFPTVGVIGTGPLGQLMLPSAQALGINLLILGDSTGTASNQKNLDEVRSFAKQCQLVTFENELVPLSVIKTLESEGFRFQPTSNAYQFSQAPLELAKKLSRHHPISQTKFADYEYKLLVLAARSPHGQAATWAPTSITQRDGIDIESITPVPQLDQELAVAAQNLALSIADEIKAIGVMAVEFLVRANEFFINDLKTRPHEFGNWTIEASITNQFEQHLRAILDLPLGDTSMTANWAVTGRLLAGEKTDMYRPYLHLMARTPTLKFHQYRIEARPGRAVGHITMVGENLDAIRAEVLHAQSYVSGEIDE